jgi:hypothetical protein
MRQAAALTDTRVPRGHCTSRPGVSARRLLGHWRKILTRGVGFRGVTGLVVRLGKRGVVLGEDCLRRMRQALPSATGKLRAGVPALRLPMPPSLALATRQSGA